MPPVNLHTMLQWARPPATAPPGHYQPCSPAEASAALDKCGPIPPKNGGTPQQYARPDLLTSEPGHIQLGVARYIPRKNLPQVTRWLVSSGNPLVITEILLRQNRGDGHMTATTQALRWINQNVLRYQQVARLMEDEPDWLAPLAHKYRNPWMSVANYKTEAATQILAAFRPLTREEHNTNVLNWWCYRCSQEQVDSTWGALAAAAAKNNKCCVGRAVTWGVTYSIVELSRGHEPPATTLETPLVLSHYEAEHIFNTIPSVTNGTHMEVVEALDVALQRDLDKWAAFAQTYAAYPPDRLSTH